MNHAGKLSKVLLQVGFALLIFFSPMSFTTALADQVTDVYGVSTPEDAWAYLKFANASHGFDTTYVPTRSDVSNSQFLGFVVTPATGAWGGAEFFEDEDTVFVFATVVRSTNPVTIPLVWNGDDGHSVFVNGIFVGGGGFGEEVSFDLTVNPDAPVKLELVGYNGPGPWVFHLLRRDTNLPLTSTPGVTLDACTEDVPIEICGAEDSDGDGIPDNEDECPNSDLSTTVIIDGCNTGVPNTLLPSGCTISDLIAACAEGASNHGQFVSCVSHLTNDLKKAGTLTGQQKGAIQSCAAQANFLNISGSEHAASEEMLPVLSEGPGLETRHCVPVIRRDFAGHPGR
jgi:hypothetical protein